MNEISSGTVAVSSGQTSTGFRFIQEGRLEVLNGGMGEQIELADGGKAIVSGGGILYVCTVSAGGTATVLKGGYAENVTVEKDGIYRVSSGGTANECLIKSGGTQFVHLDGIAADSIIQNGGMLIVSSRGISDQASVQKGGTLDLLPNALAQSAVISGMVHVNGGVLSSSIALDGGEVQVMENGYAFSVTIDSGGSMNIFGGSAGGITADSGGCIVLCDGALSNTTIKNSGVLHVSGGNTNRIAVRTGGKINLSGGMANSMTVHSGGSLIVSSGATAMKVRENGGYVEISDGAEVIFVSNTISDLTLSGASATVHSGTTANSATINAVGYLEVFSGGTATEVLENGGYVSFEEGASVTFASNTISGLELAGIATVHSGTTATKTTVNAGGRLEVFSGGTVNGVTVNSGGTAEVSSGVISGAVVNADGSLLIYDGTKITGRMVFESGAVVIPFVGSIMDFDLTQTEAGAGALVNDLSILMGTPSYTLTVADAQAEGTYALADGAAKFNSTITVQNTSGETLGTLTVGGKLDTDDRRYTLNLTDESLTLTCYALSIGPVIENETVTVSGYEIIRDATVLSGGRLHILDGTLADETTVNSGGRIYISGGGIADHTTVNSDGSMYILSGGSANSVMANSGTFLRVSNGATATEIVENGGHVSIADSATVSFVEHTFSGCVLSGASATVHSGTTANDTTLEDWGILYVYSGGTANRATVSEDGLISILGGTVDSATLNADGSMYVRSGGRADHTTINAGGCLYVSDGTASGATVNSGGSMYISPGGTATGLAADSGACLIFYVAPDTYIQGTSAGSAFEIKDGAVSDYTVNENCKINVSSGCTADIITVNGNGELRICGGAFANGVTVNGGNLYIQENGSATNIVWTPCKGHVRVSEGGYATFASEYSGVYYGSGNKLLSNETVMSGKTLDAGFEMYVMGGGTANKTTVNKGGKLYVSDGGIADSTTLNSGGNLYVSNGGFANNTMLNAYGILDVCSGGTANKTSVNEDGELNVSCGGVAASATVNSGGFFYVFSGGTANRATVNADGELNVSYGGTADNTAVNSGGTFNVDYGGTANHTTVNELAAIEFYSDSVANGLTVNAGGTATIECNAAVTDILENGGYVDVDPGATVTFLSNTISGLVLEDERKATLHEGTTATSATVNSDGGLYVCGGTVDRTTVNDGGKIMVSNGRADSIAVNSGGNMIVTDGGKATGVAIHAGGSLEVRGGGSAADATVNSGANMFVASNGTATDVAVSAGGRLELGSGGMVQSAVISSGGIVTGYVDGQGITFDPSAVLQFDLSVISPGNEKSALVNLSGIAETPDCPSFTLLVSDSQDYGDYKLAENAWGFETKTISVSNSVMEFGTLSLDRSVVVGNKEYTLNLNKGDLILSVNATQPTQYVYLDFDGENLVRYNNSDLELSFDLSVADPAFSDEQRAAVVSALSERYGKYNIAFALERPEDIEYSTLYFGVSSAFDEYGDFFGISETCDGNDQVRDDNAFVLVNSGYSDDQIITVASHMLDRLMGLSWSGSVDGSPAILKYAESKALLSLSAGWNQKDPYNKYCPIDPNTGDRCVVGCTNTAASQIIFYWIENGLLDFTLTLMDSDAYQSNRYIMIESSDTPESGHLSFAETNKLLQSFNILDENGIAALCFAAGVVQQADYASDETATPWNEDLFIRAGFEKDEAAESIANDDGSSYYDILVHELLHGRPVGVSFLRQDHAIVADGYDSSRNMFHLDLGWGNDSNRWYTVEEMEDLSIYVDISGFTPVVSPDLTIEDLSAGKAPVEWKEDVTLTFTVSNDGKEISEETMAYVYCGDAILGACGIANISPGYSRDFTCTVNTASLKVGENILTVKVGSQNDEGTISAASVTITCMNGDVIPQTQTWEEIAGATQYVVEYSTDDFEHVVQLDADTNALDSYQLPEGNYQVRVKPDDGEEWTVIEPVVAEKVNDDPKLVRSNADGNSDVFFVNSVGTWKNGYAAQHVSSADDPWGGTKECVSLVGKNKLTDIFEGSTTDANVLLMSDDANGDALFVDDIYSASPDELGLSQSRIALIDEIRAGAGDDIVDMTSNKFEYTGNGLTICGGDGDDVLWANKGNNWLFGDAGNDRIVGASGNDVIAGGIGGDSMHGGGGDDIFTFCENWGIDTVEQLATGSVTLWFASKSGTGAWDADKLTYTDGENSVKVSGITADKVTLKFGDDGSAQFASLIGMGAFNSFTSQRIFEESGKGILASP